MIQMILFLPDTFIFLTQFEFNRVNESQNGNEFDLNMKLLKIVVITILYQQKYIVL